MFWVYFNFLMIIRKLHSIASNCLITTCHVLPFLSCESYGFLLVCFGSIYRIINKNIMRMWLSFTIVGTKIQVSYVLSSVHRKLGKEKFQVFRETYKVFLHTDRCSLSCMWCQEINIILYYICDSEDSTLLWTWSAKWLLENIHLESVQSVYLY